MLILKNNTKSFSKIGYAVIFDPNDNGGFIYAPPGATSALGIVTESVAYRKPCKVATLGETANVYVPANVLRNDRIRLSKSTDRISLGACTVVKESIDAPYLSIGTALANGKNGLISCILDFVNIAASDSTFDPDNYYTKTNLQTPGQAIVDWENIANVTISVTALFLDDSASDITGYHRLLTSPSNIAEDIDTAISSGSAEVLIDDYAMDEVFNSTILNGGAWHFIIFGKVNTVGGTNTIIARVYERKSDTSEVQLFAVTTPALTTSVEEYDIESVQPDFMVGSDSRLVIKFYALSTSIPARTISLYHNGTTHYSHIHTTFSLNIISGTAPNVIIEEFETVSKNLRSYPYALSYGVDGLSSIVYDLGGGDSITKTFNYTLGVLTSLVLSGDTPSGVSLTKTLSYTGDDLTSVTYS